MFKGFTDKAWDDINYWIKNDKKLYRRIQRLIADIERDPFDGIGEPEGLKHDWSGWWSRRIDQEHRLVYKIRDMSDHEKELVIASARGHY
ncbi:MAG: Txe/YoeB family addiction module toxin [Lentisphaerales bacterium]|nr:Txe/YoeB family addiction module toxin [Lentisphaerales bacterium]